MKITGGTIVQDAPDVRLGGSTPTEQSVLGTTQALDLTTLLTSFAAAFTEISTSIGSAASAAAATACAAFIAEIPNMLSTKVKIEP